MKPVQFLGDWLRRLRSFPEVTRQDLAFQIYRVQIGLRPVDFKAMPAGYRVGDEPIRDIDEEQMMKDKQKFDSVWDAIGGTSAEAANLRMRAELIGKIAVVVEKKGWSQAQAARCCGISQPRMNDLLRGRISKFSLDALVNAATALGCEVKLLLRAA